jgi:hypothetical protein
MYYTNIFQNIFQRLVGTPAQQTEGAAQPMPVSPQQSIPPVHPRVSLIVFDPILPSQGGQRLRTILGWNETNPLMEALIQDLREVSYGYVNYQIVEHLLVEDFPPKEDGFVYTGDTFLRAWRARTGFHQPDTVDYHAILAGYDLVGKINRDEIDEVWLLGFPYAGFYESRMAGPGAFWINAPPIPDTDQARQRFVIMGFNYERGVGEMLENFGHRAEFTMDQVYRLAAGENLWQRFIRHHRTHPGQAEVGSIHFAPNSRQDYDWGNLSAVPSRHHTWYRFPDLSGSPVMVDAREWGGGDMRAHHKWWFRHIPHVEGESSGVSHNWWEYIIDPERVQR